MYEMSKCQNVIGAIGNGTYYHKLRGLPEREASTSVRVSTSTTSLYTVTNIAKYISLIIRDASNFCERTSVVAVKVTQFVERVA